MCFSVDKSNRGAHLGGATWSSDDFNKLGVLRLALLQKQPTALLSELWPMSYGARLNARTSAVKGKQSGEEAELTPKEQLFKLADC